MTDPQDLAALVAKLREDHNSIWQVLMDEAADALEAQAAEIARLTAALEAAEKKAVDLESELSDWRNGDLRGVMAHMEAFMARAEKAEAALKAIATILNAVVKGELRRDNDR